MSDPRSNPEDTKAAVPPIHDDSYSSSVSGSRPEEVERIQRLVDEAMTPPALWGHVPDPREDAAFEKMTPEQTTEWLHRLMDAAEDNLGAPDVLPAPSEPMAVGAELVRAQLSTPDRKFLRVRHWRATFWVWRISHWIELPGSALRALAYRFTEHAQWERVTTRGSTMEPWAPTRHKVDDLVDALRAITHLSDALAMPSWLPVRDGPRPRPYRRADEYVSCANGLLHVPTRCLHDHSPAYFNGVAVPFDHEAEPAPPTLWLAFLDDLWPDDPDAIAALQQWFGYVISGRTDLHKILLVIGPTRAGKGVIARVLRALVGKGSCAGPTLASLGTNFGLQPLMGKPLAIVADARLGDGHGNQVVERLLSVSGEDTLTVDVKHREPWTGTLPTRFVVISNELPRFGDASGAIANRFIVLTLQQSWLGREDTHLTDRLLTELPGILAWSLDGLAQLTRQGRFTEPRSSADAILALADLVSPVSAFVRDRCVIGPGYHVSVEALYATWRAWADDNGHKAGSVQTFGRNLRAVVPALAVVRPRVDDQRERRFQGIGVITTHNDPDRGPLRTTATDDVPVRDGPRPDPSSVQMTLLDGHDSGDELPPDMTAIARATFAHMLANEAPPTSDDRKALPKAEVRP